MKYWIQSTLGIWADNPITVSHEENGFGGIIC